MTKFYGIERKIISKYHLKHSLGSGDFHIPSFIKISPSTKESVIRISPFLEVSLTKSSCDGSSHADANYTGCPQNRCNPFI